MRTIRLVVEYDGTRYAGWQRQENALSVQEELERTLERILGERPPVIGAGRTDAGVHARGQVAHFRTAHPMAERELLGALNALLPDDIVVHSVEHAADDFHARYSARSRTYTYTITREPSALARATTWLVRYRLDAALMQSAADLVVGTHDFTSFCRANADVGHHRCTVSEARWRQEGALLVFTVRADRFLHGMVRALVGTMVDVGRGFTTLEAFGEILERRDRQAAGMSAPPQGLVLEEVAYTGPRGGEFTESDGPG